MTEEFTAAIKEQPFTTLAIIAGLAFAGGALWNLGHQRPQTRLEALRAQLAHATRSHSPRWDGLLQRWWR
jgi:hypothetical protein